MSLSKLYCLDVTVVLINYVFPRYLLAEWWVGGFLPTLLVRSFACLVSSLILVPVYR